MVLSVALVDGRRMGMSALEIESRFEKALQFAESGCNGQVVFWKGMDEVQVRYLSRVSLG